MLEELINTPDYRDWQWNIAVRLRRALEAEYVNRTDEIKCVRAIIDQIALSKPFLLTQAQGMSVTIEAVSTFMHGSIVKFSVGGEEHKRELADLLVLGSYVENGSLRWQRACFIQTKRERISSTPRIEVDEWQLALLGNFPEFKGLTGILKGLNYHLRNRTGMLGAYGMLTSPGDLTILSARVLNHLLGGRKSLLRKEVIPTIISEQSARRTNQETRFAPWWPFDPENCRVCRGIFDHSPFSWHLSIHQHQHPHHVQMHASGNRGEVDVSSVLSCLSLDEFVESWTALRLGELWTVGATSASDQALGEALFGVVSRVAGTTGRLRTLLQLMSRAHDRDVPRTNEESSILHTEDGGISIISVIASRSREEQD